MIHNVQLNGCFQAYLNKSDWFSARDYVKKSVCQVLQSIYLIGWEHTTRLVLKLVIIILKEQCPCETNVQAPAPPLYCHLELSGELLPAPARPRQAGPGRQLGHGAQLVPQFPNRASNDGSQRFHNHRGGLY